MQEETWCFLNILQEVHLILYIYLDDTYLSMAGDLLGEHFLEFGQLRLQLSTSLTTPGKHGYNREFVLI